MDSEHRHELQKNDLQEFLSNGKEFWDKYGTHVLLVILIVLAGIVFFRWYGGKDYRASEAGYAALADTARPEGKAEVAREYDHVPGLAGKAMLEAADIELQQALLPEAAPANPDGTPAAKLSDAEKTQALDRAAGYYRRVIELDESPLQTINGHMGLAAVLETQGKFDEAAKQYDAAAKIAGERWPKLAELAERLKGDLKRIAAPVRFAKAPALPETGAGSVPPGPGDGSIESLNPFNTPGADGTTPAPAPGLLPDTPTTPDTPGAPEPDDAPAPGAE